MPSRMATLKAAHDADRFVANTRRKQFAHGGLGASRRGSRRYSAPCSRSACFAAVGDEWPPAPVLGSMPGDIQLDRFALLSSGNNLRLRTRRIPAWRNDRVFPHFIGYTLKPETQDHILLAIRPALKEAPSSSIQRPITWSSASRVFSKGFSVALGPLPVALHDLRPRGISSSPGLAAWRFLPVHRPTVLHLGFRSPS